MTNELYEKHCWALVDLDAMQSNLALIKKTVGAPVCCVVKADAYGHGAAVAGPWLEENGAAAFAVSCLAEARHLRRHGISKPILILGYTDPLQVDQLVFNCITQTVYSEEYAKALSAAAQNAGVEVHCHFKVDTGMGRIGFSVRSDFEAAIAAMERCAALPKLHFSGIFQHFAVADSTTPENEAYTQAQHALFERTVQRLQADGIALHTIHCANSAAQMRYPEWHHSLTRAGIILYGLDPSPEVHFLLWYLPPRNPLHISEAYRYNAENETIPGSLFSRNQPLFPPALQDLPHGAPLLAVPPHNFHIR